MARNKRGSLLAVASVTLCVLTAISVFAHSGRTDQNGGHWDRKTGTYHFHTGEYAGRSSSGSSSPSEYVPFTPPYDPPTDNPHKQDDSNSGSTKKSWGFWDIVLSVLGISFASVYVLTAISAVCGFIYDTCLERYMPGRKIRTLREKIKSLRHCWIEIAETDAKIAKLNKTAFTMNIFYEIDTDGLPCDTARNSHWGDSFTLYRTDRGEKLHRKYNCCSATKPVHAYWYRDRLDFKCLLCKKCSVDYVVPDVPGYDDYLTRERAKATRATLEHRRVQLCAEIESLHKKCNSRNTKFFIMFSKNNKKALQEANKEYCELKRRKNKMKYPLECWCNFGGGDSGDSYIEMEVTEEEFARLEAARKSGKEFSECEEVADLYDRAWDLAEEDATDNLRMADILEADERAGDIYSIGVCFERSDDDYDDEDEYDEEDE